MKTPFIAVAALLVGCRKPPAVQNHYYSLVLEASEDQSTSQRAAPKGRVDLVEVTLPDFLMSRSLVLQVSTNEIRHSKEHHWGEPLDVSVGKVLAWDLATALPTLDIAPGHGRGADCSLFVEFDRFHANSTARVLVSGRYTLVQGEQMRQQNFDVTQVQRGDGYSNAVKAMRGAVRALSEELSPLLTACTSASAE